MVCEQSYNRDYVVTLQGSNGLCARCPENGTCERIKSLMPEEKKSRTELLTTNEVLTVAKIGLVSTI